MIEYWLQKKTLGGWSHVTRYIELEEAKANYDRCSKGNSGYSWRLCEITVIEEKLLEDHSEVENIKPVSNGWSDVKASDIWVNTNPKSNLWAETPSTSDVQHGMVGKVWMINHSSKVRMRANAEDVESLLATGLWQRGGPKTAFRS